MMNREENMEYYNSNKKIIQSTGTVFSDIGDNFENHLRNAALNFVKSDYLTANP
jgi:methyltransferase-like protein